MSANGAPGAHKSSGSFSGSPVSQAIRDARASTDSERSANTSSPGNGATANGHASPTKDEDEADSELDPITKLQRELDRTREEKDALAAQYRNLLAKLTTMRTTLGNKLKQDAVRIHLLRALYCC